MSRDKLARTPTQTGSPAVTSSAGNKLLEQATRNLFITPAKTDDTSGRIQNEIPERMQTKTSQEEPNYADRTDSGVRLLGTPNEAPSQRTTQKVADVSLSNIMDFSNTSLLLHDTVLSDESSDDILKGKSIEASYAEKMDGSRPSLSHSQQESRTQHYSLSPPDYQSPVSVSTQGLKSAQSPLLQLNPVYKSAAGTPPDLPLVDMEQTMLEMTRTKTPQLPTRARRRVMSPLEENHEDDLITSTSRLSLSPLMNIDFDKSPAFRDTSPSDVVEVTRTVGDVKSNQLFETTGNNALNELGEWNPSLQTSQSGQRKKTRPLSGSSQKSVTFSEHVDQHSFRDLSYLSEEGHEEAASGHKDDADNGIIDVQSMQAYEYIEVQPTELNIIPPERGVRDSPLVDANAFSETYLRHSPRSKVVENSSQSPLDSALHSRLDLSEVYSLDPAQRMQLLEHPTITPSKTPTIARRKGVLSQGHAVSSSMIKELQDRSSTSFNGLNQSPSLGPDNDSGFSNVKLSGSLFMNASDVKGAEDKVQHSLRTTMDFGGLFGE